MVTGEKSLDITYGVVVKYNTKHPSTESRAADAKALQET